MSALARAAMIRTPSFLLRTAGGRDISADQYSVLRAVDPRLPLPQVRKMDALVGASVGSGLPAPASRFLRRPRRLARVDPAVALRAE